MTSPEPMRMLVFVRTSTLPRRTRPNAGAALAVTLPGTVHEEPAARTVFASVTDTDPKPGLVKTSM